MARAPLRWAGSKRKSIGALTSKFPQQFSKYVEPFAGSACIAFHLKPSNIALGDLNPRLIEFYSHLRDSPSDLYEIYISLESSPVKYYDVREIYNREPSSIARAAHFLYLNRHCFNGIYRVNAKGHFNVPWGGDKVGAPLSRDDLMIASSVLEGAAIECSDFEDFIGKHIVKGAVIYIDPPYARNEERVFREYHENSFATSDWSRLVKVLKDIDKAGAHFLLSYAGDAELMAQLEEWNAGFLDVTRNVGGFKATRRKYREFMATNLPLAA